MSIFMEIGVHSVFRKYCTVICVILFLFFVCVFSYLVFESGILVHANMSV